MISHLQYWTLHQDYLWFLALLGWSAVLVGYRWMSMENATAIERWMPFLGLSGLLQSVLELIQLATDRPVPYTGIDMGLALSTAIIVAGIGWASSNQFLYRALMVILAAVAIGLRSLTPWLGSGLLAFFISVGALIVIRRTRASGASPSTMWGSVTVVVATLVSPHGPISFVIDQPRIMTDFPDLGSICGLFNIVAALLWATSVWSTRMGPLRRWRSSFILLLVWLSIGLVYAELAGRNTARNFSSSLLKRTETIASVFTTENISCLDPTAVKIDSTVERRYPDGSPVTVALVPHFLIPEVQTLRARLRHLHAVNRDLAHLHFLLPCGNSLIMGPTSKDSPTKLDLALVFGPMSSDDRARLQNDSYVTGPSKTVWGTVISARVPVRVRQNSPAVGWLVGSMPASRWAQSMAAARLHAMMVVGAGAMIWALWLAYSTRQAEVVFAHLQVANAEDANRQKSEFLAKVSHELRTPIQSVIGYGELLDRSKLDHHQRNWLEALSSHASIMMRLVNDLLDLGALQSGAFPMRMASASPVSIANESIEALTPRAQAKGLKLELILESDVPDWIETDEVRLRQILLNLLTNAVKYTPDGQVTLKVGQTEDSLVFTVSDTGPGIDAALAPKLFEPFVRLAASDAEEGTGIGLAMVAAITKALKGTVGYIPTKSGATFLVQLPKKITPPPSSSTPDVTPDKPYTGLRIVVADDNTLVRELVSTFLEINGAQVVPVADGIEAVNACTQRMPDAVVLDLSMPRMDGESAAARIRSLSGKVPWIIGLSAHVQPMQTPHQRDGFDRFLVKPVSLRQLDAALAPAIPKSTDISLSTRINPDLLEKFHRQFAQEAPEQVDTIMRHIRQDEISAAIRLAHYLKNSADVLGARSIADLCGAMEAGAVKGDYTCLEELGQRLETAVPKFINFRSNAPTHL